MISIAFYRTRIPTLTLAMLIAANIPSTVTAQQVSACYSKNTGTLYRVGVPNTPASCTQPTHTLETWGAKLDANGVLSLTNANGLVAAGTIGQGNSPAAGAGTRMMWYPAKAAFRAGKVGLNEWDDFHTGIASFAGGNSTLAWGDYSTAFGNNIAATGEASFVAGSQSTASGSVAVSLGLNNKATGDRAVTLGEGNVAGGVQAVAIGSTNTANGDGSVVLGSAGATTPAAVGAFVFSDRSTPWPSQVVNSTPNSFLVHAIGGVTFAVANGAACSIPAGGGQWACSSSRLLKSDFSDLDAEDLLTKIRTLPVQSWSYTAEGSVRHIGPMAQDFRAAFGLGTDDTTIGVLDAAGVSLAGVKALDARTQQLQSENAALRSALDELTARVAALQAGSSRRP
jgi:hypothetical protein